MNWYSRGEKRYVEYGSSWQATRTFGLMHVLYDIVFNMNLSHLSREVDTVFERLSDAGLRTACTTFLIYRGRTRHEVAVSGGVKGRVVDATSFRYPTYGPTELFYGELFHSRETGCPDTLARPGTRDRLTGCVGAYLAERDLFDFLLFSLPDNDYHSHNFGPHGTLASIEHADKNLAQMADAVGGIEAFLEEHAVILLADHSQTPIERSISLADALSFWQVLRPNDPRADLAELAVSPTCRSAMIYLLDHEQPRLREKVITRLRQIEGVGLVFWLEGGIGYAVGESGTLSFTPGGDLTDLRGQSWSCDGALEALALTADDGLVDSHAYPDALGRVWSALNCPTSGDILISAAPGYEFTDWGGADHVGGGSHGALHRGDSLAPLVFTGCGPSDYKERSWALQDVAGVILEHFGLNQ